MLALIGASLFPDATQLHGLQLLTKSATQRPTIVRIVKTYRVIQALSLHGFTEYPFWHYILLMCCCQTYYQIKTYLFGCKKLFISLSSDLSVLYSYQFNASKWNSRSYRIHKIGMSCDIRITYTFWNCLFSIFFMFSTSQN